MEPSICIEMIYPELSYEERIEAVARYGFRYIEFWSWKDKNPNTFARALQQTGIRVSNYSGQRKGDLILEDQHPQVEEDLRDALRYQKYYSSPNLMVLAQELGEGGRVVRPVGKEAEKQEIKTLAKGIRRLLNVMGKEGQSRTTLVFEPLNTRLDHPGYGVSSMETAERIYREVAHPNFGILLDLYHQGMSGDDLLNLIQRYIHCMRYVHIADIEGRHEPRTKGAPLYSEKGGRSEERTDGDNLKIRRGALVEWISVLQTLSDAGYKGFVGFEFQPADSSDRALERIAELWSRLR